MNSEIQKTSILKDVVITASDSTTTRPQWEYRDGKFIEEDKLDTMFRMQYELQKFLGTDFNVLSLKDSVKYIKEFSLMAQIEFGEMLNELPFLKNWKNYDKMSDAEINQALGKAREEYIDILHFMINIGLLLDFSGSDIFYAYKAKNEENYERQKNKWNEGTHYTYKE